MSLTIKDLMFWPDQHTGRQVKKRDVERYDPDIIIFWDMFSKGLWSLSLKAPICDFVDWTTPLPIDPPIGKIFFEVMNWSSFRMLIENNTAGPDGECLDIYEIRRLYASKDS